MNQIFYTADTHFGHRNIIAHCNRPFETVEDMDEYMITKWNEVVGKNDIVYHLGDVGMRNDTHSLECVSRLNGRKRLIYGNHDSVHPMHRKSGNKYQAWSKYFESITGFDMHRIAGREVMLSHFPYAGDHTETDRFDQWRLRNQFRFLIHGHVHNAWVMQEAQYNVGVDVHEFEPVPVEHIDKMIRWHDEVMKALDETEHDKTIVPTSTKENAV